MKEIDNGRWCVSHAIAPHWVSRPLISEGIIPGWELTGCVDDIVAGSETLPMGEEAAKEQQESQEQLGKELENEVTQDEDQEQLEAPMSESAWTQSLSSALALAYMDSEANGLVLGTWGWNCGS